MIQAVSAIHVRQHFGDILSRVALRHDQFVIKRGKRPMAAIIPIDQLETLRQAAGKRLIELYEKNWALQKTESSPGTDRTLVNEAKHKSRQSPLKIPRK